MIRSFTIIIFSSVFIIINAYRCNAQSQVCNGSLGDPVINQDFGSGQNPGPPLAAGITNMQYTSNNCPDDGQYTISNSLTGTGNCHQDTWHNVTSDHTGNPNGYMMIVNASLAPSIFFTQTAPTLCPGTKYQFSAYILNLITLAASGPNVSEPNITFSVETTDGQVLATNTTGTIPPTANPTWVQKTLFFTTPNNATTVVVKMTNNAPGGNGNDLILDDITFRACGPVIESGFGSGMGSATEALCQGQSASYTLKAVVDTTNSSALMYQWQSYNANTGWVDTAGQTADTLNVAFVNAIPGTYQYRLGVANGTSTLASCRVYSQALVINVSPNPVITGVNATMQQCVGDTVILSASGGTSYQWSGPNLPVTTSNPVVINGISQAGAGTYTVVAYNQYDCSSTTSAQITVNPVPVATASGSTTICAGESTRLMATGGTAYLWSPGETLSDSTIANPVATPADTTVYRVKVSNASGCFTMQNVTVNILRKAIANAGSNKVIFEGQSVRLSASEKYGNLFYWTPTTGLNDPTLLNPIASPDNDITYTLHVTSTTNCGIDSSSVFIKVYKKITIPNTFSPNGDGINDYWEIDALITYPQSILQVFDRYGQQVFRSEGYSTPWDGRYNGQPVPAGTYYYVLDLKNNTPKVSGWVLVVR
ncbi:gliding motility-associated C-terminal domain-containing protein [Mucilaginibacter sp.]